PGLDDNSDIDVFIIVRRGRLWLARLLVTLVSSFFRFRRTKRKIKNKICLSFYLSDDSLNLEKIAIDNDIYLMYWLTQLIPFYDPEDLLSSLQKANTWVEKFLPNAFQPYDLITKWRVVQIGFGFKLKKFFEKVWQSGYGDLIESQAKGAQQAKIKMNYLSVQNANDTRVVVNDKMLKFHESDRRVVYRDKWAEKCKEIEI
ncbi:MAG: hypothetical protein WA057_03525, partial [Candidatus Magasanikiibacteriota bacterium]